MEHGLFGKGSAQKSYKYNQRVKVRDNVNDWWNYLEHSGLGKEQKGHKKLRKAKQKPPTKSTPDRR